MSTKALLPQFAAPTPGPEPALDSPGWQSRQELRDQITQGRSSQQSPHPPLSSPDADDSAGLGPVIEATPRPAPTGTSSGSKGSGDPEKTGRVISGLLAIATMSLAAWVSRRGIDFRQPTQQQRDDIAMPLGRVLVRHLPMAIFGDTLGDIAESAAALQSYALPTPPDPLFSRMPPEPAHGIPEYQQQ